MKIEVKKKNQPKLGLDDQEEVGGDTNTYRFHPDFGVLIHPDELADFDDEKDLNDPGHDSGDQTFKWKSLNQREKDIRYFFLVQRQEGGNKWRLCSFKDPTISNRGN